MCPIQKDKKIYCEDCEHINWKKLKPELLINHLKGYREEVPMYGYSFVSQYLLLLQEILDSYFLIKGQPIKNGNSAFVDRHWNAYPEQWKALFQTKKRLLAYDNGILSAATAFGKTVVCSYLITQWEEELKRFLVIDEELPEYQTKTGRVKKRTSVIGILKGGKDTMTGIIDIAMIGSLYKKGKFHEKLNTYGMIIMDECHHAASATAQEILKKVNAKHVYGMSATSMRSDNLEKINYMLLGAWWNELAGERRCVG